MRELLRFVKDAAHSRMGWSVVVLHHSLAFYYFAGLERATQLHQETVFAVPELAGRYTSFSDLGGFLFLIDLLPILSGHFLLNGVVLLFPDISGLALSWVYAALTFIFSSLQWLMLGHFSVKMSALYRESYEHTTTNR